MPPLSNSSSIPIGPQYLYISTPSITPITYQIKQLGSTIVTGTVSRDTPAVFDTAANGNPNQFVIESSALNTVLSDRGYIIEAQDVIYVSGRIIDDSGYQAGAVVSKGLAALGKTFRIGGMTNSLNSSYGATHQTFISVLATENNTTVTYSNIGAGAVLVGNAAVGNTPPPVILNAGQSYVIAVQGPLAANRAALIGSLVSADKPIAVNCGSLLGSNGELGNVDMGFDQIVSAERTGKEYIFVKSTGQNNVERVLLIAHEDGTEIYLNGGGAPTATLNAGQYVNLTGVSYNSNGIMYVSTNKNVFAYQSVGDGTLPSQANQELFFVPPLSCETPKEINNIPFIEQIGTRIFTGRVTITTKAGSTLNFIVNGTPFNLAGLIAAGATVTGPTAVTGNPLYECYTIKGLGGNVSVASSTQLYLAAYGSDGAATFGGYYSGFTFKPEVVLQAVNIAQANCIPNVELKVSAVTGFDQFQWYFNGAPIATATANTYSPTQPGYYKVKASLSACSVDLFSDEIPVSNCATNADNDAANDNIDLDYDNDGITNCTESYGNQTINTVAPTPISVGTYNNTYTATVTTSTASSPIPFTGNTDGSFITEVPAGKQSFVKYELTFAQPLTVAMDYVNTASAADLLNSNAEFIVNSPINQTITVINPTNQLLIDTNYDGIYESGVTQFSSFEVRFRLNSTTPLAAGTGTFRFITNNSTSISITHKNLLDTAGNKATFKFYAVCVPKDSDGDGVADQFDYDSDNDGITDRIESQGAPFIANTGLDTNADGIDNVFGNGLVAADSDADGVPDYIDLDSDNDGIYDLVESGCNATDANNNGIIDGTNFGANGLNNSTETAVDSGILNYTVTNTDADSASNYLEKDSDNDLCNDVIEAGFLDSNSDGFLGTAAPPTVNSANGLVTSGVGYTTPNPNYVTAAPISISVQPANKSVCELQNTSFTLTNTAVDSYQWQISINNGGLWNDIINNATYSGATTASLSITNAQFSMNNYQYRVFLNKNGNSCGLYSAPATLTIFNLPVISALPITIVQCDDNTDGIAPVNLEIKNGDISTNSASSAGQVFTYYTTPTAATNADSTFLIPAPTTAYVTGNTTVWARIENSNGCFRTKQIDVIVQVTQLANYNKFQTRCDDLTTVAPAAPDDRDGIATFNFGYITADIQSILGNTGYTVSYYRNQADFFAQVDSSGNSLAIPSTPLLPGGESIYNYRNNAPYQNSQVIYIRVESTLTGGCYGNGTITLTVEGLPTVNPVNPTATLAADKNLIRVCDNDQTPGYAFNTSAIENNILNGQTNKTVTYYDASNNPIVFGNPYTTVSNSEIIKVRVTNNTANQCYYEGSFELRVDALPQAFTTAPALLAQLTVCDDEADPKDQNGMYSFDTSTFTSTILGAQTGMDIKYTLADGTVLTGLPNPFNTANQDVTVTVTNQANTTCPAVKVIQFIINPTPKIDLNVTGQADQLVCSNIPTFTVTIDAGITDATPTTAYNYQWFKNGTAITGATNYSLAVNTEGLYTVAVSYPATNCEKIRTIKVVASDIATINSVTIEELSDTNSISIIATGGGDYVYNIDNSFGPYQAESYFTSIDIGTHTLFIKDLNGCGITSKLFYILGTPPFFTPNGDGFNDTWNVRGVDPTVNANSIVQIFDRYGKLIKQISPVGTGWDGTYNGSDVPSDDYWYSIKFTDGRSTKGHFSLKR